MADHPSHRSPSVVCIDDDPQVAYALELCLEANGCRVAAANHGMHGVALANRLRPDVIITDVRMPQGAGDYVVERLKSDPRTAEIPILVLTGSRDSELQRRMVALGVSGYFIKPAKWTELRDAVFRAASQTAFQRGEPTHAAAVA